VGGARSLIGIAQPGPGRDVSLGDVLAAPAGAIAGAVATAAGRLLAGATIVLRRHDQQIVEVEERLADADGRFWLAPAMPGTWECLLRGPAGTRDLQSLGRFAVRNGETVSRRFAAKGE
jgi:hypothetical protein